MAPRDPDSPYWKRVIAYERRTIEAALRKHKSFSAAAKALGFESKSAFQTRVEITGANPNVGTEARQKAAIERRVQRRIKAAKAAKKRADRSRSPETRQRAAGESAAAFGRRNGEAASAESGDWKHYLALCATERQLRRGVGGK